jgi:heme/copper-type cytochrome/quinol oxidase subunit 4
MKDILQSKAAGFWVALVLTMGPALIAFLGDAQSHGWVDAGIAGAVILVINSLVKFMQVSGAEEKQRMLHAPDGTLSMAAPIEPKSKIKEFLFG